MAAALCARPVFLGPLYHHSTSSFPNVVKLRQVNAEGSFYTLFYRASTSRPTGGTIGFWRGVKLATKYELHEPRLRRLLAERRPDLLS